MKTFFKNFHTEPINYGNASHAFYDIMKWVQKNRPKKNPNIIMPAYIPAKLYRFVLAAGYKPKFYDVTTQLDFSIDEIEDLIDDQTQMVFAAHFFGIPTDLSPLKKLTQESDLFLFEDCAHTFNSHLNGNVLGTTGDFTIFSTRKMFQYHCGGFLILNNQPWHFEPPKNKKVSSVFTGYHLLGSRVKYYLNHLSRGRNLFNKIRTPEVHYIDFDEEQTVTVKQMDRLLDIVYQHTNLEEVTAKRRENVRYLWNHIDDLKTFSPIGLERLSTQITEKQNSGSNHSISKQIYQLVDGYVPFSLPILTPPGIRNYIQHELLAKGIECYIGWTEAPFGMKWFLETEQLQMRLLELPVHHFINPYQLDIIANCLNNVEIPHLLDLQSIKADRQKTMY